jgi:hypothetical protein
MFSLDSETFDLILEYNLRTTVKSNKKNTGVFMCNVKQKGKIVTEITAHTRG